jgi:LL-diaminopimelate aminotransferase
MVTGQLISIADRFKTFPAYPLADVPQIKRELLARGVDVIDLGAGDADLAAPPAAVQRLQEAVRDPAYSRYGFQLGLPAYREAVSTWMEKRFNVALDPYKIRAISRISGARSSPAGRHSRLRCVRKTSS